jgi:hypothetical protein
MPHDENVFFNFAQPFPEMPPRMHWRTYMRIAVPPLATEEPADPRYRRGWRVNP